MKVTIEHFTLVQHFGEEKAFELISKAGFDGVDYSFNSDGKGNSIDFTNHAQKAKEVKALLDKYNLVAPQAHAPFALSFNGNYEETFSMDNKDFSDVVKSLEFASIIGCEAVVVHSIKLPPEIDFFECNYNYYKALEPYAQKFGVKIAVENLVNSIFWRPNRLSHFIRQLNSPVFCACIDVGHSFLMGMPPEEFIAGMDPDLIACVHLHDTDAKVDRHWAPYQGDQNWEKTMKALADYGYKGDINLEVIRPLISLPKELQLPFLTYCRAIGEHLKNICK